MTSKYPKLLSPLKMGDLELPTRVVMAPLTRGRAGPEYTANEMMAAYYAQRAGAGLIISEGTGTSFLGRGWFEAPEIFTQEHAAGWKVVTDSVHEAGGRIFCQLWHTGRTGHTSFRKGIPGFEGDRALSVAPSAIQRKSHSGKQMYTPAGEQVDIEVPRALSLEEIKELPLEYINAAQMAKDAGFDGVEIHSANGYLLDEFLQSCSNEREDEYGGSFENRFRLIGEVVEAVQTVFEPSCTAIRLSPNGSYNGMGSPDNREAFLYYVKRLADYNLGYLHIMIGLGFGFHGFGEPLIMKEIRDVYPGILMANVGYTAESAEKEISDGYTDLVSFGRPYIPNPDLVERFRQDAKLAEPKDPSTFYSSVNNKPGSYGYTDYLTMEEEAEQQKAN